MQSIFALTFYDLLPSLGSVSDSFPHLESADQLNSSASTGISGNPNAPSPVNTPHAEELPSLSSKWSAEYKEQHEA
uniref:Uncharacterized protein n=1 Tax=Heterorhabditis bacteriophora TaxID=37862 RepID=A0A1I7WDX6_HETBA